jgi:hypothetical protein
MSGREKHNAINAFYNLQRWGPRGLSSSSRTPRGQNLAALASNLFGLGLDAVLLRLGVLVSVAGIYANVIRTIAKIHLIPSTCT